MGRKEVEAQLRLNGYGPEKGRFRASVLEVNGYRPEKRRLNVHNVHFFILFLNEWTSKRGFFMPQRGFE